MALESCHSRWCPNDLPGFRDNTTMYCQNVSWTFVNYLNSTDEQYVLDNPWVLACCKLFCGEQSQLLQLQCQGTSETIAKLLWIIVGVLVLCVFLQLMSVSFEKGARKVAVIGGPLFLAFIAVIVYVTASGQDIYIYVDTPFYPIVGAMSVGAFSYYFSSFQYSIGLQYELAAATALVFTMIPIWTLLTVKLEVLVGNDFWNDRFTKAVVYKSAGLVLVMVILSLLWIVHSGLYRTVGYRAAWITAFNKQSVEGQSEGPHINFMSSLWILAGAQGHPTWRTPVGQSIGLYLTVLSWFIARTIHNFLQTDCNEDLILFHILLWVPPVILTMAALSTQITIFIQAPCDLQEYDSLLSRWLKTEFQSLWETSKYMKDAVISYRLGRNTLEVESDIGIYEQGLDNFWAPRVFYGEILIFGIAYPGICVLRILQLLGIGVLKCTSNFVWFEVYQRLQPDIKEKIRAYRTLCEHCHNNEAAVHYRRSIQQEHGGLNNELIAEDVRNIFREYRKSIMLPLLLDNISPSRFRYLLQELVNVLNERRVV